MVIKRNYLGENNNHVESIWIKSSTTTTTTTTTSVNSLILLLFLTMSLNCLIANYNCHKLQWPPSNMSYSRMKMTPSQAISTISSSSDTSSSSTSDAINDTLIVAPPMPIKTTFRTATTTTTPPTTGKPSLSNDFTHPEVMDASQGEDSSEDSNDADPDDAEAAQLLLFDGDELLDDDDEDEDNEESFYNKNPVDFKNSLVKDDADFGATIKVDNSDFNDFDDHEALKTADFYSINNNNNNNNNGTTKKAINRERDLFSKLPHHHESVLKSDYNNSSYQGNSSDDKYRGAESSSSSDDGDVIGDSMSGSGHHHQLAGGAARCAVVLQRGLCITFATVEWAAREARRILKFDQPEDSNSPELSESAVNSIGELNELTTRLLAKRFHLNPYEVGVELELIDITRTSLWRNCPAVYRQAPTCLALSRYRTHTGQCNNLQSPHLGSSYMPFKRLVPADYADGVGVSRRASLSGRPLPPARLLALNLHPDIENPSQDLSVLFMSWGQLINHDLALASGARVATGHDFSCCRRQFSNDRVCMPIHIGPDDPLYGPHGMRCMDFKRSIAALRPGCLLGPRIQLNTITSFIDGSFVYGSRRSMSAALRQQNRGLLSTWNYFDENLNLKPLLPPQLENPDEECVGRSAQQRRRRLYCFQSGDARTNQQIQLVALHTLHTRQHNRLARALAVLNPHWQDNRLYHEARHIHIALIQHVLLSEYLPLLLGGEKLLLKYSLKESPLNKYWDYYDSGINPSISQAFAAAAFRQGHTTIPGEVFRFNYMHDLTRVYQLRQLFRQPWPLFEPGAMDEFLLGMLDAPAQASDPFISQELSGHLLEEPGARVGLDLTAINIQRGRDQGVASYNTFRDWCGLKRLETFADLTSYMSNGSAYLMEQFYETVDDIDLFTGGISEFPLDGAQVGPTFACIIGHQFSQLRAGDRFWFETSMEPQAFTLDQLNSIKQVSLARILCSNSDRVLTIQQWALRLPHPVLNPRVLCNELPDLDITLWTDYGNNNSINNL